MIEPDLRARLLTTASVRLFGVLWGGMAVIDLARHAHAPQELQVLLLAALVGLCCLRQPLGAAAAIAGLGWLVVTGFVVHRYGDLAWSGSADLTRLGVLAGAALLGTLASRPYAAVHTVSHTLTHHRVHAQKVGSGQSTQTAGVRR